MSIITYTLKFRHIHNKTKRKKHQRNKTKAISQKQKPSFPRKKIQDQEVKEHKQEQRTPEEVTSKFNTKRKRKKPCYLNLLGFNIR